MRAWILLCALAIACGGDDDGTDAAVDTGMDTATDTFFFDGDMRDAPAPDANIEPSMFMPEIVGGRGDAHTTHVRGFGDGSTFAVFDGFGGTLHRVDCSVTPCGAELILMDGSLAPVVGSIVDFDGDSDDDIVVAGIGPSLGVLGRLGAMEILDNDGTGTYTRREILDGTKRAVCAETGDLDGDDDLDVLVCEFGESDGRFGWLETTDGDPVLHTFHTMTGTSHAYPVDVDDDGDLDLMELRSQLDETIYLWTNDGSGNFESSVVFQPGQPFYGLSDLFPIDFDGDDDIDFVVTNGDAFDGIPVGMDPADLHGVAILENDGAGAFTHHDAARFWGCYVSRPADLDLDGDLDIITMNDQDQIMFPDNEVVNGIWLENMGDFTFEVHPVPEAPSRAQNLDVGDVDGDGDIDVLTGTTLGEETPLVLLRNGLR